MPVIVPRGRSLAEDEGLRAIADAFERYLTDRPGATVELYRRGKYMVRARVTDPRFVGLPDGQRYRAVWSYLDHLPDEVAGDLTFLIPAAPGESDAANTEFDHPTPIPNLPGLFDTMSWPDDATNGLLAMRPPPVDVYGDQPAFPPPAPSQP